MLGGVAAMTAICASPVCAGCGATEEEMAGKDRTIAALNADLHSTRAKLAEDESKLGDAQNDTAKMRDQLKQAGLSADRPGEAVKAQQAVMEYKLRAELLALFEGRVRDLRTKLEKLAGDGVKVGTRKGRLVVTIPSDVLFDAGHEDLRIHGREVLTQIAEVLRADKDLANRDFLAAAHTDSSKAASAKDALGLTLARARSVTQFLIAGGLNPLHWGAAGYGEFDPLAGSVDQQTKEEAQRNRRIELVLQPSPEEGLNVPSAR
jgi:chemotaxis protein MotB